jgi:hypothetical protein
MSKEGNTVTMTFKLRKATKKHDGTVGSALQYGEVVADDQPERMGTIYLKRWMVPQPYPEFIRVAVTIPVGVDLTGSKSAS